MLASHPDRAERAALSVNEDELEKNEIDIGDWLANLRLQH